MHKWSFSVSTQSFKQKHIWFQSGIEYNSDYVLSREEKNLAKHTGVHTCCISTCFPRDFILQKLFNSMMHPAIFPPPLFPKWLPLCCTSQHWRYQTLAPLKYSSAFTQEFPYEHLKNPCILNFQLEDIFLLSIRTNVHNFPPLSHYLPLAARPLAPKYLIWYSYTQLHNII